MPWSLNQLALALPLAWLTTQEPYRWSLDGLGIGLAALGDVDGDGHADFAAGAPKENDPEDPDTLHPDTGEVVLFSGRTFAPIWRRRAKDSTYFGDQLVAMDDLDGDGAREIVATCSEQVWMLSGATGDTLWTAQVGRWVRMAAVPDADGDGHMDVAAAALEASSGAGTSRSTRLLSGRSGKLRWLLDSGEGKAFAGRWNGVGIRDRDGDGNGDIAFIGWAEANAERTPAAVLLSGKDGSTLDLTMLPYATGGREHATFRLVVVGHDPAESRETLALGDGHGRAWLIPGGRWTSPIALGTPAQHKLFGSALAGVHDLDGDGVSDVLVTGKLELDQEIDDGFVWAYSGRTGLELPKWRRSSVSILSHGFGFGERATALGDVDADGIPDILVAAVDDWLGFRHPGTLIVLSGADARVLQVIR